MFFFVKMTDMNCCQWVDRPGVKLWMLQLLDVHQLTNTSLRILSTSKFLNTKKRKKVGALRFKQNLKSILSGRQPTLSFIFDYMSNKNIDCMNNFGWKTTFKKYFFFSLLMFDLFILLEAIFVVCTACTKQNKTHIIPSCEET